MREFVVPSAFFDKAKGPDTPRIAAALPEIDKCCKALDVGVARTGHLVRARPTNADMNVIPMLSLLLISCRQGGYDEIQFAVRLCRARQPAMVHEHSAEPRRS
jgi:glutathione S-transferase